MFRTRFVVFVALLALAGCRRPADDPKVADKVADVVVGKNSPTKTDPGNAALEFEAFSLFTAPADAGNPQYDAALTQGLTLLADQDYAKALDAFETAKAAKDTDFVRGEIAKLKARIEADAAAKTTTQDIQALLDNGDPQAANKLVTDALKVFGGGAEAGKLVQLQAQADALLAAGGEDPAARARRLRDQAQVALQDQNLRAAAAALQQSLLLADDATVREQLGEVMGSLDKYDALRKRAAELRRDPADLEDALTLYKQAKETWNTPEVRQDIDDCTFALQKRRDTVGVADFEVQGNVGVPAAGDVIADELLPTLKARFDLVDRDRIEKIQKDLNLGEGFQDNPDQQREVGKLARARFLVLGSVNRAGNFTARARLVDVETGLIVQTAKISAPTFDQLLKQLPNLTKQLLMTDDEKLAFDQAQLAAAQAVKIEVVKANAPLPAPPPAVGGNAAPGPWLDNAPPPAFGNLQPQQFLALQPAPAAPPAVVIQPPPVDFRAQLVAAAVQMGDGFFVRGQFRQAFQQYEFALSLAPNDFAIRARLDQCRPLLPPVVVVPVARPRLAILNFLVIGHLPPALSERAPDLLEPYLRCNYDIVDQNQVYWMMGRLGLSQFDIMNNPIARVWLGRALGVQYFLLGDVRRTASFDVNTYLLNAETGWLQGKGHIHVQNSFELKLRAGELAQITQMLPGPRAQFVAAQPQVDLWFTSGRKNLNQGNFTVAISFFENILGKQPGNIQAMFFLNQARQSQRQREVEELRRRDVAQREALAAAEIRRQRELTAAAERQRVLAVQLAASRAEADRLALAKQRAHAYADMVARARDARKAKNFALAVNLYQGALDMPAPGANVALPVAHDVLVGELAGARADIARANSEKARAEQAAAHEAELRKKRETELAVARQKLKDDQAKADAIAAEQRKTLDAKYQAAFDQGQALMAQNKFEAAIVAFQGARQLKKTDTVEAMLNTALGRQAEAQAKGDAERKQIEMKLAAERKRQKEAEAEAKRNHDQYDTALAAAKNAFAQKKYDVAQTQFEAADKLFSTNDTKAGLKRVQSARAAESAAEKEKADKADRAANLLKAGNDALTAGNFADSLQKLEQARRLDPTNVDVLAAIARAERARTRAAIEARPKTPVAVAPPVKDPPAKVQTDDDAKKRAAALKEMQERQEEARRTKARLAAEEDARKAKAAEQAAKEKAEAASKAAREEAARKAAEQAADAKKAAAAKAAAEMAAKEKAREAAEEDAKKAAAAQNAERKKKERYADAIQNGQRLANERKYADAIQTLQNARTIYPNDPQAAQLIAQTNQAWEAAKNKNAADDAAKKRAAEEAKKNSAEDAAKRKAAEARAQFQNEMQQGRQDLNQKRYQQAIQHFEAALRLMPGDNDAQRLLEQARKGKK